MLNQQEQVMQLATGYIGGGLSSSSSVGRFDLASVGAGCGSTAVGWLTLREEVSGEIAEALVMAVVLVTAMLNLGAAVLRLLEAELGRPRRGRGGRHRR